MTLERAVLEILSDCEGQLTPTESVKNHVGLSTGRRESLGEVRAALESLERKGQAQSVYHEDYGFRWVITDAGKVRLRS